jgi:hypothetical protein
VEVEKDGKVVSGKSIMALMTLAAVCGTKLRVTAHGAQSHDVRTSWRRLVARKFDIPDNSDIHTQERGQPEHHAHADRHGGPAGVRRRSVYLFRSAGNDQIPEYRIETGQVPHELSGWRSVSPHPESDPIAFRRMSKRISGDEATIFDGHLMILEDPSFVGACRERVSKELLNAEAAVNGVGEKYSSIFAAMDDAYLKDRAKDVGDIAKRSSENFWRNDAQALRVEHPCIVGGG